MISDDINTDLFGRICKITWVIFWCELQGYYCIRRWARGNKREGEGKGVMYRVIKTDLFGRNLQEYYPADLS